MSVAVVQVCPFPAWVFNRYTTSKNTCIQRRKIEARRNLAHNTIKRTWRAFRQTRKCYASCALLAQTSEKKRWQSRLEKIVQQFAACGVSRIFEEKKKNKTVWIVKYLAGTWDVLKCAKRATNCHLKGAASADLSRYTETARKSTGLCGSSRTCWTCLPCLLMRASSAAPNHVLLSPKNNTPWWKSSLWEKTAFASPAKCAWTLHVSWG